MKRVVTVAGPAAHAAGYNDPVSCEGESVFDRGERSAPIGERGCALSPSRDEGVTAPFLKRRYFNCRVAAKRSTQDLPQAIQIEHAAERFLLHNGARERGLLMLQRTNFFLHRSLREQAIRDHRLGLSDAMGAVDRLRLDGRVPPRVIENGITRRGQIEPEARGFQREEEYGLGAIALKLVDELGAILGGAREHEIADACRREPRADDLQHLDKLTEDEDLVAFIAQ